MVQRLKRVNAKTRSVPGVSISTRPGRWRKVHGLTPYLFLLPFFLIYGVFLLYPVLSGLKLSLYHAAGFNAPTFVGLQNYTNLLQDPRFLHALRNTTAYTVAIVGVLCPLSLMVAVIVRSFVVPWGALKTFYRIVFFLPYITAFSIVALIFSLVFNTDYGLLNSFLSSIGLPTFNWLRSDTLALPVIILIGFWTYLGIYSLYFLAGVQSIPAELNEAASVDGANQWQTFLHITLPQLRPMMIFVVVQATIYSYQTFEVPYILLNGGPSDSTLTLAVYLYQVGFTNYDSGYAAAIGYVMVIIAMAIALIQLLLYRRLNR